MLCDRYPNRYRRYLRCPGHDLSASLSNHFATPLERNLGSVIYLTGAPATGKTTLARNLSKLVPQLHVFSYSQELREYVRRRTGVALSEQEVRAHSGTVITRDDVRAVDQLLVDTVKRYRRNCSILIDSHAVTKENFGFRATPFSPDALRELAPDSILCLYLEGQVAHSRIKHKPMGRPIPSIGELNFNCQLQAAIAIQYGVMLGVPVFLVDSSVPEDELTKRVLEILNVREHRRAV